MIKACPKMALGIPQYYLRIHGQTISVTVSYQSYSQLSTMKHLYCMTRCNFAFHCLNCIYQESLGVNLRYEWSVNPETDDCSPSPLGDIVPEYPATSREWRQLDFLDVHYFSSVSCFLLASLKACSEMKFMYAAHDGKSSGGSFNIWPYPSGGVCTSVLITLKQIMRDVTSTASCLIPYPQ